MKHGKLHNFFEYHFFSKTRDFVKRSYDKYILWNHYWTDKKLEKRWERQNRHFRWSKENVAKIQALNTYLSSLMEEVYADCNALKKQFDDWILEGKDYYKNYEIKGYIIHVDPDFESFNKRQENLADAQDDAMNYSGWCIRVSDSSLCRTKLKEELVFKNHLWWDTEFIVTLKEHGIDNPCAFLECFLSDNYAYSLKDLVKMSEENFCKNLEVHYAS